MIEAIHHCTPDATALRNGDGFQRVFRALRKRGFHESAEQLHELHTLEDMEGGTALSLEASQSFVQFIDKLKIPGIPVLGIFHHGTLSAGWRIAKNKHVLLEFVNPKQLRFAMIAPDRNAPDKRFRLNGQGSHAAVVKFLQERGVTKWRRG